MGTYYTNFSHDHGKEALYGPLCIVQELHQRSSVTATV